MAFPIKKAAPPAAKKKGGKGKPFPPKSKGPSIVDKLGAQLMEAK